MTKLTRFNPFAELDALQRQFFGDDAVARLNRDNIPTTDVYRKDGNLVVEAHLPNFEEDAVDIHVDDGVLTISAERHETEEDKDKQYVVRESSSSFYRRIALGERANEDEIEADLTDGVLTVTVPLEPVSEPKRISLSSGKKK